LLLVTSLRDPLIQCERLLDAAYNALLQASDLRTIADLGDDAGADRATDGAARRAGGDAPPSASAIPSTPRSAIFASQPANRTA